MGRDLLYKPPVPIVAPDEADSETKQSSALRPGIKGRQRDLGSVGKTFEKPALAPVPTGKPRAHQAAYFNRDTSGVGQVNFNQSNVQALRGSESTMDLKKIVLPAPAGCEAPDPDQLQAAGDLMGLSGEFELSLEAFVGRHSAWTQDKRVTVESLKARMAELERLVEDRKRVMERLSSAMRKANIESVTIEQASRPADVSDTEDIVEAGRELVQRTARGAEGLHARVAKILGVKPKE